MKIYISSSLLIRGASPRLLILLFSLLLSLNIFASEPVRVMLVGFREEGGEDMLKAFVEVLNSSQNVQLVESGNTNISLSDPLSLFEVVDESNVDFVIEGVVRRFVAWSNAREFNATVRGTHIMSLGVTKLLEDKMYDETEETFVNAKGDAGKFAYGGAQVMLSVWDSKTESIEWANRDELVIREVLSYEVVSSSIVRENLIREFSHSLAEQMIGEWRNSGSLR